VTVAIIIGRHLRTDFSLPAMPAWWDIYFAEVFLARLANQPTGLYILLALI